MPMTIEISQEFEESENNSEWPELLENFENARDEYLGLMEEIWKNPLFIRKLEDAYDAKVHLIDTVRTVMHGAFNDVEFEDDELAKKLQRVGSTGTMCDGDIAEGMNNITGTDENIFATINFTSAEDVDEELSESYAETLAEVICTKIEMDYEIFFDLPRFRRVILLEKLGKEVVSIGKIASAVALGILLSEKIRKKSN